MRNQILLFSFLLFLPAFSHAQDVIARQSGGQSYFYYIDLPYTGQKLLEVIELSSPGDTLYLPGIKFEFSEDFVINKPIIIIGTGFHPDYVSEYGAMPTKFSSSVNNVDFRLISGSSNTQLHGLLFENVSFRVGKDNNTRNVSDVKLYRCRFTLDADLDYGKSSGGNQHNNPNAKNFIFQNCIFDNYLYTAYGINIQVRGCILNSKNLYGNQGTVFENNLFINYAKPDPSNEDVLYRNNIFLVNFNTNGGTGITEKSDFVKNVFISPDTYIVTKGVATLFDNNENSQNFSEVFQGLPPTLPLTKYDIHFEYKLKPNTIYTTMSTNNDPVGLEGNAPLSWGKVGALPFNPHWVELKVPNNTENGVLKINVKATAQQY